eukprot:789247-Rhodomonas_salina.1
MSTSRTIRLAALSAYLFARNCPALTWRLCSELLHSWHRSVTTQCHELAWKVCGAQDDERWVKVIASALHGSTLDPDPKP